MGAKAKVSGSVVAGFPSPAEQYLEPPLDLNELLVKRPAATYFVRVEGDSMSGAGISDGDLLVVEQRDEAEYNQIVAVEIAGEVTIRRYRPQPDGTVRLHPENERFTDTVLSKEDCVIQGVVTMILTKVV